MRRALAVAAFDRMAADPCLPCAFDRFERRFARKIAQTGIAGRLRDRPKGNRREFAKIRPALVAS
jgi:hypothetical protein